jgi:hypothetical protein
MDIEKVIESLRSDIADSQERGLDMDESDWLCCSGILISGNEARALLTEIDYWRTRCGKAEAFISACPLHNISDKAVSRALAELDAAVAGESDKARYLETLKPSLVE